MCVQRLNGLPHDIEDEVRYRILRYLHDQPVASQRKLARELGVSVGKVNYCIRAFVDKGWVKIRNFRNSTRKFGYTYILTPKGIEEKINTTSAFLRRKMAEYEALSAEIERLTGEAAVDAQIREMEIPARR